MRGRLAWVIGLAITLPAVAGAAEPPALPRSFAPVAEAARAAFIVLRAPEGALPDGEVPLFESLAAREQQTLASGIIVDPRGFALTSARAVLLTPAFEVFMADGTRVGATLLAVDQRTDVAVLTLDGGGVPLPYLPLGDSDRVEAGDWVIAVGAPMGLEGSVTAGVVTATPAPASPAPLSGFLQTDASMGLGNAGGPLVSLGGEVVGLSTPLSGSGVAYARPSTAVRKVYLDLLERGRVSRAWLGVATQGLSPELAGALGFPDETGVLVVDVHPGGPGAAAGLQSGDVIVALDATAVFSRAQLERAVDAVPAGRVVGLGVRRPGRELTIAVRLGEEPAEWRLPPALARAREQLGIEARAITPTMGVMSAGVDPAGPAGRAGMAAGDVIREVNRRPIRTLADFEAAVRSLDPGRPVAMLVQRGDVAVYVAFAPRP